MRKKIIAFGLFLLIVGSVGYGWVAAEQKRQMRLLHRQRLEIKARLDQVDKVVAGRADINQYPNIHATDATRKEIEKFEMQKEKRELAFTISILCILAGAAIVLLILAKYTVLFFLNAWHSVKIRMLTFLKRQPRQNHTEPLTDIQNDSGPETSQPTAKSQLRRYFNSSTSAANHDCPANYPKWNKADHSYKKSFFDKLNSGKSNPDPRTAQLFSDKKSTDFGQPWTPAPGVLGLNKNHPAPLDANGNPHQASEGLQNPEKLEQSLRAQTEDIDKQVKEIKQMAQSVQKTALEHSKPLNDTLVELTKQISAIRDYTNLQQDKVKKLQEGYDWNIIRTFCLRVIRCIDNLENRIAKLSQRSVDAAALQEVRDELIFALESSGVEQFEPQINSDYHGQEKLAEAVKEKLAPKDPKTKGKIARVIRPGYQYIIGESNVKIVRTAQVQLFG